MTTENSKAPEVAPTTTRAVENLAGGISTNHDTSTPVTLHLPHAKNSQQVTWGDCDLEISNARAVFVDAEVSLDMVDNALPARLCPDCVDAAVAHSEAKRREEEKRRRQLQANEVAHRRRVREEEMRFDLVDAYRAGNTAEVTRILDAFVAEDEVALAALGISSWDEVGDDE